MPYKPVDTAIKVILGPIIDDSDFKSREEGVTYDQAGLEIDVILEKADGTVSVTAVTPTDSGGDYDWAHTDQGYYEMELPASLGASYNNDTEGILRVVGYATGVLPFSSVAYDIVPVKVYNSLVAATDNLEVDMVQCDGSAAAAEGMSKAGDTIVQGTVDNTGFAPTITEFETDDITEATADHYKGRIVIFTSGALQNQATDITGYELTGGRGHFTVTALTEAPGNDDTFVIM